VGVMLTRKRYFQLAVVFGVLTAGTLLYWSGYWWIRGWCRGEPFWESRPASYWRAEIQESMIASRKPRLQPCFSYDNYLFERISPNRAAVNRALVWIKRFFGTSFASQKDSLAMESDPAALPILLRLITDSDPKVRTFAVEAATNIGLRFPEARAEVLVLLRRMLGDAGVLDNSEPILSVGAIASHGLWMMDSSQRGGRNICED
jgi:hypothetical protein